MVNLEKWEEIEYGKIKRHDTIRCITVQGNVVSDTRGVVDGYSESGIWNEQGIRFVRDPSAFKPVDGGYRTIYRRKPKAPKVKELLGAVILAENERTKDHFVFDGLSWSSATECCDLEDLQDAYTKLTVLQEGIEID